MTARLKHAHTDLLVLVVHSQDTRDGLADDLDLGQLVGGALRDLLHAQL